MFKDLLSAFLAEQEVSDEDGFGEDLGISLCATDGTGEETESSFLHDYHLSNLSISNRIRQKSL